MADKRPKMEGFPSRAKLLDLVREGVLYVGFPNSSASRWVAQICDVLRKLAYEQPEVPEQPKVETLQEVSERLCKRGMPKHIRDTAGIVLRQHLRLLKVLGFGWPGMPEAEGEEIRRQTRHVEQMLEGCEP